MPCEKTTAAPGGPGIPARVLLLLLCSALPAQSGCINVMAIAGKVLFGDPVVISTFERNTGVRLQEGHTVGIACLAPASVMFEFDALHLDVQEALIRRMRLRGIEVVSSDRLIDGLDDAGGEFNEQALAEALPEVDYLLYVELARFTAYEDASPNLYRGRAHGSVAGYEVRRDGGKVHTIPVFQQDFSVEYPGSHPISTDQLSKSTFVRRCIDEISSVVGRMFYDVPTSELY